MNTLSLEMPRRTEALESYLWKNRLLLVFSPSSRNPLLLDQLEKLRAVRSGLVERDLLVLTDTEPEQAGDLRDELVIEGFEVLLIGKDGGVKARSQAPVTSEELFTTIDAMPMRRRERQKQSE